LDITMVLCVGLLVALSISATALRPFVQDWIATLSDGPMILGALMRFGVWALTFLVPIVVSFLIFSALSRIVPAVRTSFSAICPGDLFAALRFEIATLGFPFFLLNSGDHNAIYGSLGAVVVFMLFIFIAASVLL